MTILHKFYRVFGAISSMSLAPVSYTHLICGLGNWGTTNHLMTAQDYVSFRVANVKNVVSCLLYTSRCV